MIECCFLVNNQSVQYLNIFALCLAFKLGRTDRGRHYE